MRQPAGRTQSGPGRGWAAASALAGAVLCSPYVADADIAIRHDPVSCVPEGKYLSVTAVGEPAEQVASATLQFRQDASAPGWYSIRMTEVAGRWVGVLPRPMKELGKFDYRITMTTKDLQNGFTTPFSARVVADGTCATPAGNDAASIVVEVPPGAAVMPPVPPGFSPAGVVAAAEPRAPDRRSKVKWASGAVAAATLGALVAGVGSAPPEPPAVPEFTILETMPGSGSTFSLSRDRLSMLVAVSGEPLEPITFTWFVSLQASLLEPCLSMTDTLTLGPARPQTIELASPLRINGFCGTTFSVHSVRLTLVVDGQVAREVSQAVSIRVVP